MNSFPTAKELRRKSRDFSCVRLACKARVAIVGYRSTDFLARYLAQAGVLDGIEIEIYQADYRQVQAELFGNVSALYRFQPEYIWVVNCSRFLHQRFYNTVDKTGFYKAAEAEFDQISNQIACHTTAQVIFSNLVESPDGVFGHYGNKTSLSFLNQIRRLNVALMDLAQSRAGVHVLDVASIAAVEGTNQITDDGLYVNADVPFTDDFEARIACEFTNLIGVFKGRVRKCLVFDLDNTIWGGVVGDDGVEGIVVGRAFANLQHWIKILKERGIILAVCSKNSEVLAKEVFEKHKEMVLKLSDIAVFVANWKNKADNIRYIRDVLDIGFDSMVVLDDSPAERALIERELPDVFLPKLPTDPAAFHSFLQKLNLFETAAYSPGDNDRTAHYQEEARRQQNLQSFTGMSGYLASLNMKGEISDFRSLHTSRISQLCYRSNQFNLRTIRYAKNEVEAIRMDSSSMDFEVVLEDRYGKYGLISIMVLRPLNPNNLFIENWLMSCRVLNRGVEYLLMNHVIDKARASGYTNIFGEYLPTARNIIVADLYADLGFVQEAANQWRLTLADYQFREHAVELVTSN